jgi:phosphoenolpyruvate carboxylase
MGFAYELAKLIYQKIENENYATGVKHIDELRAAIAREGAFTKEVAELIDEIEEKYRDKPDDLAEEIERIKSTHPSLIRGLRKIGGS